MSLRSISFAAFAVLAGTVILLTEGHALFAHGTVAVAAQIVAMALMIWARVTFGRRSFHAAADPTAGGLVTHGPYRFMRHPIYAAILLFLTAGVGTNLSASSLVLWIVAVVATWIRIISEEQLVVAQYPEYAAYAARTKRVIPFVL